MPGPIKRTTVYLDPDLHKALRLKSVAVSRTMSDLINAAVREALSEDAEDIASRAIAHAAISVTMNNEHV